MTESSIWLPKGEQGDPGPQGPEGPPGPQGPVGGPGPDAAAFVAFTADLLNPTDFLKGVSLVGGSIRVVANVNILKTLPSAGVKAVFVVGGVTRFDGGGGLYQQNVGDFSTPGNNGSIVIANDNARWFLANPRSVTPEHFGAIGDWNGTTGTDNSVAFANLSLHLATYGGEVVINKRYNVASGWIMNSSNVEIRGIGELHCTGVNNVIYCTGVSNVSITGIVFSQPLSALRDASGFGIYFVDSNRVNITNCETIGGTAGIWLNHCTHCVVSECLINTPKADGIHFSHGSSYCKALGNTVLNPGDDALACTYYAADTGRPNNLQFIGNKVRGGFWGFGCSLYGADDCIVASNDFRECALGAVQTTTNAGSLECTNISILNNTAKGLCRVNAVPNSYWYGTADIPVTSPLHKTGASLAGTNIKLVGNDIDDVSCPVPGATARTGIYLAGGTLIKVNSNAISRVSGLGIQGGASSLSQCSVNFNTMDSIADVFIIFNNTPLSNGLSIVGNETGLGANTGSPNMVFVAGAGTVKVVVANNTSEAGRAVAISGSTNVINVNNNF